MKRLLGLFVIMALLVSCNKDIKYSQSLSVENKKDFYLDYDSLWKKTFLWLNNKNCVISYENYDRGLINATYNVPEDKIDLYTNKNSNNYTNFYNVKSNIYIFFKKVEKHISVVSVVIYKGLTEERTFSLKASETNEKLIERSSSKVFEKEFLDFLSSK